MHENTEKMKNNNPIGFVTIFKGLDNETHDLLAESVAITISEILLKWSKIQKGEPFKLIKLGQTFRGFEEFTLTQSQINKILNDEFEDLEEGDEKALLLTFARRIISNIDQCFYQGPEYIDADGEPR